MRLLVLLVSFVFCSSVYAQKKDPILFTVDNEKVYLSEFKYIYQKNNAKNADYSKQSVHEYLDLYKKFKLKVHKAKENGLDTVKSLQDELAGYRKQLAKSYLSDKEINDRLVNEIVSRMKTDVELSHIFVSADAKSTDIKKQGAVSKINEIHKRLIEGVQFDLVAKTLSEDKSSAKRDGYVGYYTAPLPDGFYEFENAMYNTPVGEFSEPLKSKMGYHIIKVSKKRPARGQVEIAHILIRKKSLKRNLSETKILVDSIHGLLVKGRNYENMAAKFSEDTKTKGKGGYLGYIGINQYETAFEDGAFALKNDNEYSQPIETEIGYHILKRINKRDNSNVDVLKKRIKAKITNHDRFSIAEKKLIEDVKKSANFSENQEALKLFYSKLNDDFFSYKWNAPSFDENVKLFELDGQDYKLVEFSNFVKKSIKDRLKFNKIKSFEEAISELYNKYVDEKVMEFEEKNLESKYPDFKSLMREYSEGILLFEITKKEVWDKASQDTSGLRHFFNNTNQEYKWPERVKVMKYTLQADNPQNIIGIYRYAQKKDHEKLIKKYESAEGIKMHYEESILDKGDKLIAALRFKDGALSELKMDEKSANFYKFIEMVKPRAKTLNEARGYVIADYQDFLELKWIEELSEEFPIKVNKNVLKSIIK